MENLDLDINNYDLNDLKKLFNMEKNFTKEGLKTAYKMTLMTHPDKSGLDKEYFLFFSQAFKMIKKIYDYTHREESCAERKAYDTNQKKDMNIMNIIKKQDVKTFNKKFNKLFEEVKIHDEETDNGYDDWFKSNEDIIDIKTSNVRDMNNEIDKLKTNQRSLILHNDIQDLAYNSGCHNLVRDKPQEYSSDIFSKLQYEDLKKAHTETVVPVTEEDYINRRHFNNVNDLNMYRKQNQQLLSQKEYENMYKQNKFNEEQKDIQNAYKMMKQTEEIQMSNEKFKANFKLLGI